MGLISSWKKSKKLRRLQLQISPPDESPADLTASLVSRLRSGHDERNEALEEFLTLCESDKGVKDVMERYEIDRNGLKEIYMSLTANGLGQWIKGHQAALSSIAYFEPLLFYVECQRRGESVTQIVSGLFAYWEGQVPNGGLLKALQ